MGSYETLTVAARRRAIAARAGLVLAARETTLATLYRAALILEPTLIDHRAEFFEVALWALGEAVSHEVAR